MSNQVAARVQFDAQFDGLSSVVQLNLERDPYVVSGPALNWFTSDAKSARPTGVGAVDTFPSNVSTIVLSGNVITVTYVAPPPAGVMSVPVILVY